MRIFIFAIFISFCLANDGFIGGTESNNDNSASIGLDANETHTSSENSLSFAEAESLKGAKETSLSSESISADEKLKDNIVHFDRVIYSDTMNNVKDPFIYINQQSEEELANIDKIQNTKLVLYAVFDNKAKVNNSWVTKNDKIDGWLVTDIKSDRVELKFNAETRILYVYSRNNKFNIK